MPRSCQGWQANRREGGTESYKLDDMDPTVVRHRHAGALLHGAGRRLGAGGDGGSGVLDGASPDRTVDNAQGLAQYLSGANSYSTAQNGLNWNSHATGRPALSTCQMGAPRPSATFSRRASTPNSRDTSPARTYACLTPILHAVEHRSLSSIRRFTRLNHSELARRYSSSPIPWRSRIPGSSTCSSSRPTSTAFSFTTLRS